MDQSITVVRFAAKHRLSAFAIASLTALCVFAALDLESARSITLGARDATVGGFDWLFVYTVSGALIAVALLAFHPGASQVIGQPNDKPEFSRWAWFSMLFSAGLASGLVYWGTAEPITHFAGTPFTHEPSNSELSAIRAVTVTVFHWGLHGWGLYAVAGLAIALAAYRNARPLTFSAALAPIIGSKAAAGWPGRVVDLLALYGTVFGVATSLGLAAGSMNAALEPLIGLPFGEHFQIAIVLVVSVLGVASVLSGVARGIRRLSEFNVWLSLALMGTIAVIGPTAWLASHLLSNAADYTVNAIAMGFWLADDESGHNWQTAWTVFYWGWWLAWTPFVGLFIARISKGRTVREFILGVLFVPALVVLVWMSVFGGTALHQELAAAGAVSTAVEESYSLGLIAMISNLATGGMQTLLLAVVALLLFTWLITSLDSATLVICHTLHMDHLGSMKVLWGFILGGVTCTLMLIGGLESLQAASIIIGLPMALLVLLLAASAIKLVTQSGES
ncbi:MAG: BCCT family transporter [Pseudomonadaceae bacterium]|nr:BCCT family transporter [Pseudomonadaceae bacterium]